MDTAMVENLRFPFGGLRFFLFYNGLTVMILVGTLLNLSGSYSPKLASLLVVSDTP
jgi:hypothetical protein